MSAPARWLVGPWTDLMLGCGFAYLLLLGGATLLGIGPSTVELWAPSMMVLVSVPHYGATLLRVYENGEDRRKYRIFTLHATLVLILLFAIAVRWPLLGSIFNTLYLSWSPWHYSGQNYGISMMFLRRRGLTIEEPTRRALHWSYISSFAIVFVFYQAVASGDAGSGSYRYLSAGLPNTIAWPLCLVLGTAYLGSTCFAFVRLKKHASLLDLLPSLALTATHGVWFVLPVLISFYAGANVRSNTVYFLFSWVALGHAIQYLWITGYFATSKAEKRLRSNAIFFLKALATGAIAWAVPALVFAPGALSELPYDLGLSMMVASLINLHHFILDGAIWKLRDGKVAQILLRAPKPETVEAPLPSRVPRMIWGLGAACVLIMLVSEIARADVTSNLDATGALDSSVEARIELLALLGRDEAGLRNRYAEGLLKAGDRRGALHQYERSLELHPSSSEVWYRVGILLSESAETEDALQAFDRALSLRPDHPGALEARARLSRHDH